MYYLGLIYSEGYGVSKDFEKAFRWFKLSADKGHPTVQAYLGMMYFSGNGTEKDDEQAAGLWKVALDSGDFIAQMLSVFGLRELGLLEN
jgi:TPR repeat protein